MALARHPKKRRDKSGRWRDAKGRFTSAPKGRAKKGSVKKSRQSPPQRTLSHARILQQIERALESHGIDIARARSEEELVRGKELWHYYTVEFSDHFTIDAAPDLFDIIRPSLGKHYRSRTSLRVLVGIDSRDGEINLTDWRSISDTLFFGDAFSSLDFNLLEWLKRGEYSVLLGVAAWVRCPRWYEKQKGY